MGRKVNSRHWAITVDKGRVTHNILFYEPCLSVVRAVPHSCITEHLIKPALVLTLQKLHQIQLYIVISKELKQTSRRIQFTFLSKSLRIVFHPPVCWANKRLRFFQFSVHLDLSYY